MGGVLMVTGGSRGIGAAVARLGGARGYSVCVNYHSNHEAAQAVVSDIEAGGGRAIAVQADCAREDEIVRLFAACDQALGPVTALAANAGVIQPFGTLQDLDEAELDRMWRNNISSVVLSVREAAKRMARSRGGDGGSVVITSSAAARLGGGGSALAYAASKGALDTLNHGLALELGPEGIRVNAVRPGLIDTEIHAAGGDADRVETLGRQTPMGRPGSAEEVADTILYLMSEQASYVTDSIVEVAGGR